jgi:hypothetical protein
LSSISAVRICGDEREQAGGDGKGLAIHFGGKTRTLFFFLEQESVSRRRK